MIRTLEASRTCGVPRMADPRNPSAGESRRLVGSLVTVAVHPEIRDVVEGRELSGGD